MQIDTTVNEFRFDIAFGDLNCNANSFTMKRSNLSVNQHEKKIFFSPNNMQPASS